MNKRNIRFFTAFSFLSSLAIATHAADLTIRVEGPASGKVYLALYDKAETWINKNGFIRFDRGDYLAGYTAVFKDLPSGSYAIAAFIDMNDNAKLDLNPGGMPLEPYGISRDAKAHMAPPAFSDAAIELSEDTTTTINLR